MCGAAFFSAGRGKGKNPWGGAGWGGAKVKIHGAGRKSVNQLIPISFTKVRIMKNIILHIMILIIKLIIIL